MPQLLQVTTTTGSREAAEQIGKTLVEEKLAACAQITGPITSFYRWQAKMETASEWYCHLKTTPERYAELAARLRTLHSYETPEIIAVRIDQGSDEYAQWVEQSVKPEVR